MNFRLPTEITVKPVDLDALIEAEIRLLKWCDDNVRFFNHLRGSARTDYKAAARTLRAMLAATV